MMLPTPRTFKQYTAGMDLRKIQIDEIEKRERKSSNPAIKKELQELIELSADGCDLYWVSSAAADWEILMGWEGYIAVRGESIVAAITLRMN